VVTVHALEDIFFIIFRDFLRNAQREIIIGFGIGSVFAVMVTVVIYIHLR